MSYTVLAVKWRPRKFADLLGQEHVVQALVNSLAAERLHHAYLFAGTRGVGKTTVARILAKALNCETGVVPEPCGVCDACVAIDQGRFVDLIEVDAASRTKVDDTRELLDNVQYTPTQGRFKVYLIDEVHMLSNHSFNALLKTLEEPPPHVKFLLATTDPQKLPVTVLSRCLQFNLKKLKVTEIESQLAKICAAEGASYDAESLRAIAKAAAGSVRDALSLLDQSLAFGGGKLEAGPINAMLGNIDRAHVTRLLEGLADADGTAIIAEARRIDELAPDYSGVLDELMEALQQLAVLQLVPEVGSDETALEELAARISAEDVQLYYQIAVQGRRDLAVSRDPRVAFEMTLLRMLAFRPVGPEEDRGTSAGRSSDAARPTRRPDRTANPGSAAPGSQTADSAPAPVTPGNSGPTERAAPRAAAAPSRNGVDGGPDWAELVRAADIRGAVRQLAEHCALVRLVDNRFDLVLAKQGASLNTDRVRGRLKEALGEYLGKPVSLRITEGETAGPTPAELRAANEDRRRRAAREALEEDPNVRALQSEFDAVLEGDTIEPADE